MHNHNHDYLKFGNIRSQGSYHIRNTQDTPPLAFLFYAYNAFCFGQL